jgi:uncharacterized membrane protein (DUF373 family)
MKIHAVRRVIHLEAVLVVALIAVARGVVVLEPKQLPEATLLGMGVMTLAIALGYCLVRRSHRNEGNTDPESKG